MIPADANFWTWWLPLAAIYFVIGFVIWLLAAFCAEAQPKGSFWRTTLATYAAFWLVWPLSTAVLIIWLLGFGAVAITMEAWSLRSEDKGS